jgi:hypothetical protein
MFLRAARSLTGSLPSHRLPSHTRFHRVAARPQDRWFHEDESCSVGAPIRGPLDLVGCLSCALDAEETLESRIYWIFVQPSGFVSWFKSVQNRHSARDNDRL